MIEISTKIHDRFSIEFKVGFVTEQEYPKDDFLLGMWIFVPASLDMSPSTFTKTAFYRDFKSNVRLITPRFPLSSIVGGKAVPLSMVKNATEDFDYQIKMFVSIVKSSVRNECETVERTSDSVEKEELCRSFASDLRVIIAEYGALRPEEKWGEVYRLCGEFLCNVAADSVFRLLGSGICKDDLSSLLGYIENFREENGFPTIEPGDSGNNSNFVYRHGILKKYAEGQLFLRVPKTRDGFIAEQAYYSVAAGLAMLFATVVAWAFQRYFGNLTWPLFIALIISYMMKDRIKELMRFYFSHKVGSKYFDNKAEIRHRDKKIGYLKEGMDFIPMNKVPQAVLELRARDPIIESERLVGGEKVILYRKLVHIDREALGKLSSYKHEGINDIIRLQIESFLHKTDNPTVNIGYLGEDGNIINVPCAKVYYLNFVFQYDYSGKTEDYRRFRVTINRDGIKDISEIY